jgi:lysozyme
MSTQTDFINKIKSGAQAAQKKYGVLASLTIAQAILESGWGQHAIANNLFGIKTNGSTGPTVTVSTKEFVNGEYINTSASFRAYDTLASSVEDHGKFISENARYKNLIGCTDYIKTCQFIQQDGYATEPDYSVQLQGIIHQYNLVSFDTIAPQAASVTVKHTEAIKSGSFFIHSAAKTVSGVVGIAKGGQTFITTVVAGGWRKVTYSGRTAYIGPAAFK